MFWSTRVGLAFGAGIVDRHVQPAETLDGLLEGAAAGVCVNAVAPGPVVTEMFERLTRGSEEAKAEFLSMIPAKRAGTPEEIAPAIVFLASDKARFLTGHIVTVDGGFTAQ